MNVPISLANGSSVELSNVTESGSGYVRFSDGTQVCYGITSDVISDNKDDDGYINITLSYPKAFVGIPIIVPIRQINVNTSDFNETSNLNLLYSINCCVSSSEKFTVKYYMEKNYNNYKPDISYIAIGKYR